MKHLHKIIPVVLFTWSFCLSAQDTAEDALAQQDAPDQAQEEAIVETAKAAEVAEQVTEAIAEAEETITAEEAAVGLETGAESEQAVKEVATVTPIEE